jgi:hypothetical protein
VGNVHDIFDATLMQLACNRNESNVERDRHREEEEELGRGVNMLGTKLRQREGGEIEIIAGLREELHWQYISAGVRAGGWRQCQ